MTLGDRQAHSPRIRSALLLFALVAALAAHPTILLVADQGLLGAFKQFAPDAFYYLTIASHFPANHGFSFDGTYPTNGFHPLWMIYLSLAFDSLAARPEEQVLLTLGSCTLFVAVGLGLVAVATARLTGSRVLALVSTVPGAYCLVTPSMRPPSLAPWAFINGMESSLSILIFGILLWGLTTPTWTREAASHRALMWLSLGLTLATLTRLDDVFLFVPFIAPIAFGPLWRKRRTHGLAALCLPATLVIGSYLLANFAYAGTAFPSSGATKLGDPVHGLLRNGFALMTTLVPYFDPLGRRDTVWSSESWRMAQMLLPALAAFIWLLAFAPRHWLLRPTLARGSDLLVSQLALYVVLKAGFNFTAVGLWHQGHWYYPISILTFNLIVAAVLSRLIDRRVLQSALAVAATRTRRLQWGSHAGGLLTLLAGALFALHHGNAFADSLRSGGQHLRAYALWTDRAMVRDRLRQICEDCGVVCFDDGIIAYTHAAPTMNGLGLAMDVEAARAKDSGDLLGLAHSRGYRLLASTHYPMLRSPEVSGDALRDELQDYIHLAHEDLAHWNFEVVYVHDASSTIFIRFLPRSVGVE